MEEEARAVFPAKIAEHEPPHLSPAEITERAAAVMRSLDGLYVQDARAVLGVAQALLPSIRGWFEELRLELRSPPADSGGNR
jgi:hypothetical protein